MDETLLTVTSLDPQYSKFPFLLRLTSDGGFINHYEFDHEPTVEDREQCRNHFSKLLTELR